MVYYLLLWLCAIFPLSASLVEIQDFSELMIQKSRQSEFVLYVGLEACVPCQNVKAVLNGFEDTKIYGIDLKKTPKARHLFNIDSVPCLIFFKNGQVEHMISGEKNIIRHFSSIQR